MKKIIFFLCFLFQLNSLAVDHYAPKKYIFDIAVYLYVKANDLSEAFCNLSWVKKFFSYIDISDKSLGSDEIIIIIPDENNFKIKLLNLYKINTLGDKYKMPQKWKLVTKEVYEKIKKLSSIILEHVVENNEWIIKLPNNISLKLKAESKFVEAVLISNCNLGPIFEELYEIDE